ncbi:hypothetical protein BS50DRAFT_80944 [Corynespora cassiicola Philippines]|uniref:Uncharacterized protein n=1 Tax=Corynespora cassiicola Philippines TaxID=1448308 RepID=A0A2T2NH55_CORCC|nr:hypothetical protein BS50DRAFT_80944 [Corynespora cassiicola Philippines]
MHTAPLPGSGHDSIAPLFSSPWQPAFTDSWYAGCNSSALSARKRLENTVLMTCVCVWVCVYVYPLRLGLTEHAYSPSLPNGPRPGQAKPGPPPQTTGTWVGEIRVRSLCICNPSLFLQKQKPLLKGQRNAKWP